MISDSGRDAGGRFKSGDWTSLPPPGVQPGPVPPSHGGALPTSYEVKEVPSSPFLPPGQGGAQGHVVRPSPPPISAPGWG